MTRAFRGGVGVIQKTNDFPALLAHLQQGMRPFAEPARTEPRGLRAPVLPAHRRPPVPSPSTGAHHGPTHPRRLAPAPRGGARGASSPPSPASPPRCPRTPRSTTACTGRAPRVARRCSARSISPWSARAGGCRWSNSRPASSTRRPPACCPASAARRSSASSAQRRRPSAPACARCSTAPSRARRAAALPRPLRAPARHRRTRPERIVDAGRRDQLPRSSPR